MYINNFKKEAKRLRATTWEDNEKIHITITILAE